MLPGLPRAAAGLPRTRLREAAHMLAQYSDEIDVLRSRLGRYPEADLAGAIAERQAAIDQTLRPVVEPAVQRQLIDQARAMALTGDELVERTFRLVLREHGVELS